MNNRKQKNDRLINNAIRVLTCTVAVALFIMACVLLNNEKSMSAATPAAAATTAATSTPSVSAKPASSTPASDSAITVDKKDAVRITRSKSQIKAGKKFRFKAESETGEEITWSVNKKDKASISSKGLFRAKRTGKVKVTAKTETASVTCKVKILPKKTVAIDAGHQARANSALEPIGPGASTKKPKVAGGATGVYTKVPEYKLTLAVAKKLKTELVDRGYKVVMIRTKNEVNISNKERAQKANETSDICIRIHADAAGSSSVTGASALYPSASNPYCGSISSKSKKLSECVIGSMCEECGARNRGLVVRNDLTGTNWSTIPVTLIEMGFMTNKAEDIRMQDESYQKKIAIGMAEGVEKYFGY